LKIIFKKFNKIEVEYEVVSLKDKGIEM